VQGAPGCTHAQQHASRATHLRSCGAKHNDRPLCHEIKLPTMASLRSGVDAMQSIEQQFRIPMFLANVGKTLSTQGGLLGGLVDLK
jgi:hypothetical protein